MKPWKKHENHIKSDTFGFKMVSKLLKISTKDLVNRKKSPDKNEMTNFIPMFGHPMTKRVVNR